MTLMQIIKRDGSKDSFDSAHIHNAISKACAAVAHDCSFVSELTQVVVADLEQVFDGRDSAAVPTVEEVQDAVERALINSNKYDIAKAYIIYRNERREERAEKHQQLLAQFDKESLKVTKASGKKEKFNITKIKAVFDRAAYGYKKHCTFKQFIEAFKKNIVDDIKTSDISKLLVKTCIDLVTVDNIHWQHIAARIFLGNLYRSAVANRKMKMDDIYTPASYQKLFDDYIKDGLYYKDFYKYYSREDILSAGKHLKKSQDNNYEYTTALSLAKRYLLNPNGVVKELPQEMYMSVALFLAVPEPAESRLEFALKLYDHCSAGRISLPTPTLLNARTNYHQLSSCFKVNLDDDLRAIYHGIENMAQISKFGGGIGVYLGNIRARGASIRGVAGASAGVNPWIKIINDTAIAVNQLGARLGAISVTLDMWHHDIGDFLDLQTETGDIRSKAFDVFPAVSIPDIFMRRVKAGEDWTLFDPHEIAQLYDTKLQDHFGEEFDKFYQKLEADKRIVLRKSIPAKELFKQFLKVTVETGMPYVFYRDTVNRLNPNKHAGNIYSSQLCTEICQNTAPAKFVEETIEDGQIVIRYQPGDLVVCNLTSINMAKVHDEATIADVMPIVMRTLDNVITLNYYPIKEAELTAMRYRSVGLGYLGLAEYLATRKIAYDSPEARAEVDRLFERYTYHMYRASVDIATKHGHYELFAGSEYSKGILLGRDEDWFAQNAKTATNGKKWRKLFADMKTNGVRFAYHTAPAPNTSTAGLVGTTAALLPIYRRYFVETNLSSPTIRVAPKLDKENFWYYKEYTSMEMGDVISMMAVIYKWVDQSISFEWMIDPARTSPAQLYGYYIDAWEKQIKTVYYVRSLSAEVAPTTSNVCVSCSG